MTKKRELSKAEVGLSKATKKESAKAYKARWYRRLEDLGGRLNLRLVIDCDGIGEEAISTLAKFNKRRHFTPEMRRRVIEAARAVIAEMDREGKMGAFTLPRKRAGTRV